MDPAQPNWASPSRALIRMADDGADPGTWYCANEGSTVQSQTGDVLSLRSLTRPGACSPGDGTLTLADELMLTLDGATTEIAAFFLDCSSAPANRCSLAFSNGEVRMALTMLLAEDYPAEGGIVPIKEAYLVPAFPTPEAFSFRCGGTGTLHVRSDALTEIQLRGLSKPTSCVSAPPWPGELGAIAVE